MPAYLPPNTRRSRPAGTSAKALQANRKAWRISSTAISWRPAFSLSAFTLITDTLFFIQPQKIEGGTSSSHKQKYTFSFTCTGLTPGAATTRYMNQPDGSKIVLTPTLIANSSGNIDWSYESKCSTPTGTYHIWVQDTASGKSSNGVDEKITKSPKCN